VALAGASPAGEVAMSSRRKTGTTLTTTASPTQMSHIRAIVAIAP